MGEFFKGWRRKVGVVTLMLTCVSAAGWVRSFIVADFIQFADYQLIFLSGATNVVISIGFANRIFSMDSLSVKKTGILDAYYFDEPRRIWRFRFAGFGVATHKPGGIVSPNQQKMPSSWYYRIPHWSIVMPLTLLSAWLLLSKPRANNSPA